MAGLRGLAEKVADKGRYGDSELVHMNPDEIAILEQYFGPMTINPDTGKPEAFSWKKFLLGAGLAGAAFIPGAQGLVALGLGKLGVGAAAAAKLAPALLGLGKTIGASTAIAGAIDPEKDKSATGLSEAADYLAKRNEQAKAANPGVPIIQARMNPYLGYDEGGRERERVTYGAPRPMAGGIQSLMGQIPGYAEGGMLEPEEMQARQILEAARAAMNGDSQDPHGDLSRFIETYGEEALQNLAGGGMVRGPGAGMDDMVRAQLGDQKVLLSNDEFVIPADVVSGLGDGSSDAGARKLQAMMHRVRHEKTGSGKQPGKISEKVLPK